MGQYRVFVEKKPQFATEAAAVCADLNETLHLGLTGVRVINVYDLFNVTPAEVEVAANQVLAEVVTDTWSFAEPTLTKVGGEPHITEIATEFLPGQYDQRADSAMQCLSLLCDNDKAVISSGKIYLLAADKPLSAAQIAAVKSYLINPVEAQEKDLSTPLALPQTPSPEPVPVFTGFNQFTKPQLAEFLTTHGMAMSLADIEMIQRYFADTEHRDPTETELRVLDTYWSDHCRHTTFETEITNIELEPGRFQPLLQRALDGYLETRARVAAAKASKHEGEQPSPPKPITLMDLATIAAKDQRNLGLLDDQEITDEINACSIQVNVDIDGVSEPWLLMFKNETHNHPTEIEPFGGASTCIGGAIRDPL
ncbi:MAG: phosphoribosylformylglycinamidine synthase, partial [Cellulomonadaceae bacterium]|nr:phosphoribosylformylglycinamidine synthase [Cellulomonadaceae bacterium]